MAKEIDINEFLSLTKNKSMIDLYEIND